MKIQVVLTFENWKVETLALIDCGAKGASYIERSFVEREGIPLRKLLKPIPILNVDGTKNKGGSIREYVDVEVEVRGRTRRVPLLVTSLGQETVILGYPWLRQENPNIDWKRQTLHWRKEEPYRIKHIQLTEPYEMIWDTSLAISTITGKLSEDAREAWMKTRMSHSQLFALEEEKKKLKPKEDIVPIEFHQYLDTVFSEREVGKLLPRSKYDHAIDMKPGYVPK